MTISSLKPYIIQTLIAVLSKRHSLDNRKDAFVSRNLEGEHARKIAFHDPTIEHVMRPDDRRGTIVYIVRVLLVQRMTEPLILEGILVIIVVTHARAEMDGRDQETDDAR